MITRRQVLVGGTLGGAVMLSSKVIDAFAVYKDVPATPVSFQVPRNACDTHFHLYDPQFPYVLGPDGRTSRAVPPDYATVDEARTFHQMLHIERMVIVQPQAYATDNRCTLDGIKQLGAAARGIALIDENTTDAMLDELDRGGVRGVRINPQNVLSRYQDTVKQLSGRRNWHIQLQTSLEMIEKIQDQIATAPFPIAIDHFAGSKAAAGIDQPGFSTLLELVKTGKVYVKLSRIHNVSEQGPPDYSDVAPLAKALIAANPERMLWGSDWPFVATPPIDMGRIFNQLAVWATPAQRELILVDNPARLYHF